MLGKILKGFFAVGLIAVLVIIGVAIWQGYHPKVAGGSPPAIERAGYYLLIKATGQKIYTDAVEIANPWAEPGSRIYQLKSYWESNGEKFTVKNHPLLLDEKYFGIIEVKKR